jgi:hypothetical protein
MLAERLEEAVRNAQAVGAVAGTLHKGQREYAAAADVIFHFGDVGGFQGLLAVAPDHGTAAMTVGNDEHGGALSRLVAFGEITRHTGLRRPRPGAMRLVNGVVQRIAVRVLA